MADSTPGRQEVVGTTPPEEICHMDVASRAPGVRGEKQRGVHRHPHTVLRAWVGRVGKDKGKECKSVAVKRVHSAVTERHAYNLPVLYQVIKRRSILPSIQGH